MILQALKEYYDRKAADPDSNIAPLGLEWKPLEFLIVIDNLGTFISIEDLREKEGKKLQGKKFLLPRSLNRQGPKSYCITFLLWDHLGYLLGLPKEDPKALKQHKKWKDSLTNLPDSLRKDSGVNAVLLFYKRGEIEKALKHELINECLKSIPCNMAFRINTELMPIPSRPAVLNYAKSLLTVVDENQAYNIIGNCIISGEKDTILNKHGKTPINKDNN
ncbi:MAG: type I-C CRISPR-associated protein Cas8c/Csd1, partial [Spirochaetia bacterium]|nr:type I-C CRISPR-associated protein Cas8c/Csd1 [Spirochaetia bacterium]